MYREWFTIMNNESPLRQGFAGQAGIMNNGYAKDLQAIPYWEPQHELLAIDTEEAFFDAISSGNLNIRHDLTDKGITRFADDWKAIIA